MATIEELRDQLKELEATMESERQQHAAQKDEQNTRIKQLEGRLQEQDQAKFKKIQESRKTTTTATGTKTTTTTTTTANAKSTPQRPSTASNDGSQTPQGSANKVKFSNKDGSTAKKSTPGGKQEKLTNGSTALQHSWDKFCVRAKDDFSPKELSLMSLETIKSLLVHYNYTNPIEIAQIEAQWALIQDGEKAVIAPTPFSSPNNRARSFSPMPVKEDFDLRTNVLKPHLSVRTSLANDTAAGGNPNASGERHGSPSYTGPARGAKKWVDPCACNPNDGPKYPSKAESIKRLTVNGEYPFSHKVFPRGKSRSASPNAKEITTYPEEAPAALNSGKRLFEKRSPGSAKITGLRMVASPDRPDDKKRSIRFIPQKNQVVIG